jgi:hypothetical protein
MTLFGILAEIVCERKIVVFLVCLRARGKGYLQNVLRVNSSIESDF